MQDGKREPSARPLAPRRWPRVLASVAGLAVACAVVAAATELTLEANESAPAGATFVQVGKTRIRFVLEGAEQGVPTVVLLNGIAGSVEQWGRLQPLVAPFARVLAYDRGGGGFSTGPAAHDAAGQADELAALLAALHLPGRAVLVGYSLSASVARLFAARHPERTAALVLLEPYFPEMEARIHAGKDLPHRFAHWLLHDSVVTLFGLRRLANWWRPAPLSPRDRGAQAVLQRFAHWAAIDRECLALWESEKEVDAVAAPRAPTVIVTSQMKGTRFGDIEQQFYRELILRNPGWELREIGDLTHAQLVEDPGSLATITGVIRAAAGVR